MRIIRWTIGLILILGFIYFNFFFYTGELIFKLINVILFSTLFILYRVMFGPSPADRIIAVDILGVLIIGMLALMGLYYKEGFFMDIGLIWALLSFVASIAFAKILEGRQLDD
ncbi:MAG: monovalent cation/H+ antiporter complex subunit F [Ignavibacteriales bacterium]|nr:monovalent cation/H+ antiporter complex subunit F [Ignavibacteriales bacterium]